MSLWVVEVMLAGIGTGMGLTMSPATNAIMSAVPREKAGAGSAVNNTVRQVAGALGVADPRLDPRRGVPRPPRRGRAAHLAAKLDQPAAVVAQLPANAAGRRRWSARDTSQSIGNALTFVGKAGHALQARGAAATPRRAAAGAAAQERAQARGGHRRVRRRRPKSSFMSAMHITSLFGGLVGAARRAASRSRFLPGRASSGR